MLKRFNRVFVLLLGLRVCSACLADTQSAQIPLLTYTNSWKYSLATTLPTGPNGWNSTNYDDSNWASGEPVFGEEDPGVLPAGLSIRTPISSPANGGPVTAYFRTTFELTNEPAGITLWAFSLIDDGAVVYLNGSEVFRYRINGTPTPSTLADYSAPEGAFEGTNLFSAALRRGVNVLAAELHQSSISSADNLFVMRLTAVERPADTPLTIIQQPADRVVCAGSSVTFSVGVDGNNPRYQWFWNQRPGGLMAPVSGATGPILTLPNAVILNNGASIQVVLANFWGSVTSRVAVLGVNPDTCGPRLLSARVDPLANNRVTVAFDESLNANTATNSANYAITVFGDSNSIPIVPNGIRFLTNAVVLTVDTNIWHTNAYILTVNNVRDTRSTPTNLIAPNSQTPIICELTIPLMPMDQEWLINDTGLEQPPEWNDPDFQGPFTDWGSAQAIFVSYLASSDPPCGWINQLLPVRESNVYTWYLRTTFMAPETRPNAVLYMTRYLAGGGIFYLNGTEIFRKGMPPGPVDASTPATDRKFEQCQVTTISVNALRPGTNVIAVEVHRPPPDSFGPGKMAIGMALNLGVPFGPSLLDPPSPMVYASVVNTNLVLSWTNYPPESGFANGFRLEYATNILGRWYEAQPQSRPFTNVLAGSRFFRLVR